MSDSSEQPSKIGILVLDEQPLLRQGISDYLNSQPDMMVCAEAESIWDAQSKIAECQPQVLVTALRLGAEDSLKLIKKLKSEMPRLRILVYSAFAEIIFAERAMRAGANGYVMKQAPREELPIAIREIVKGDIYVSREVALSARRKMGGANLRRGRTRLQRRRPAAKTETASSERFCYRRASRKRSSWHRSFRFPDVSHAARAVRAIRECKAICASTPA